MPSYDYKCDACGHAYNEVRDADHPQWFTDCVVPNCVGKFAEVK